MVQVNLPTAYVPTTIHDLPGTRESQGGCGKPSWCSGEEGDNHLFTTLVFHVTLAKYSKIL